MFGILLKWDNQRDLTHVLKAVYQSCSAKEMCWVIVSLNTQMSICELDSGVQNIQQRIDNFSAFTLEELEKIGATDYLEGVEIAAFSSAVVLDAFRTSRDKSLIEIYIDGFDYHTFKIMAKNTQVGERIAQIFDAAVPVSTDWFSDGNPL